MKRSKILKNTKLKLLTVIALLFSNTASFGVAHAGVRDGAGGDGVYVQGKLVMRDLINSDQLDLVADNKAFVVGTNGFLELMREIIAVNSDFGLDVLSQLLFQTKIWTTKSELPILPDGETAVIGRKADVQIAVRYENDIIISLPAFKQVNESNILLHEALHGIVPGSGPIHHTYVRTIVKYIVENRGKLEAAKLNAILVKAGAFRGSGTKAMQAMFTLPSSDSAKCALASIAKLNIHLNHYFYIPFRASLKDIFSIFSEFDQCAIEFPISYIQKELPDLADYLLTGLYASGSVGYFYKVTPLSFFSSDLNRKMFKENCSKYGSIDAKNELEKAEIKFKSNLDIINRMERLLKNQVQDAQNGRDILFNTISEMTVISIDEKAQWGSRWGSRYLNSATDLASLKKDNQVALAHIQEYLEIYNHNQKVCAE